MYILMVYDVNVERVSKVLHTGRKYLTHVQNSFLEGELSPAQFQKLQSELRDIIDPNQDAVRFYCARARDTFEMVQLGTQQRGEGQFL